MLNCTELECPAANVPLTGLMPMLFTLLLADQCKLRVFECLVSVTKQIQSALAGLSLHCWLALIVLGMTDNMGADATLRVTWTVKLLLPILKVALPV